MNLVEKVIDQITAFQAEHPWRDGPCRVEIGRSEAAEIAKIMEENLRAREPYQVATVTIKPGDRLLGLDIVLVETDSHVRVIA